MRNKKVWKLPEIHPLSNAIESGNFCAGSMEGAYYMKAGISQSFNTPGGGKQCFKLGDPFTYDNCVRTFVTACS